MNRRDKVAQRLCNLILHTVATKGYRDTLDRLIRRELSRAENGDYYMVHRLGGPSPGKGRRFAAYEEADVVRQALGVPAAVLRFNRYGKLVVEAPLPSEA